MSTDEEVGGKPAPAKAEGQAVDVDDVDESKIPTAPMRAVPAQRPLPPIEFDDDDDDLEDGPRIGTTEHPFTETTHPEIAPPDSVKAKIQLRQEMEKPNMGVVAVRVLLILGVLAGLAVAAMRAAG